jgi:general secretion pathway protein E
MYALLREIASGSPRRSVVTIEDPVESVIDSISQSELDPAAGMTLSSALRSAVRQDSEVLLVSEVRDPETAEAALQASLTGHLVFSSLHATDVAASLRRLVQLGIPHYVVRSGVRAIIAQRLVRRICSECHRGSLADGSLSEGSLSKGSSEAAAGRCRHCFGSGYRGRLAIAQCIRFDGSDAVGESLADGMERGESADQMRQRAQQAGDIDLWQRGKMIVDEGLTDLPEIYRVLGNPPT